MANEFNVSKNYLTLYITNSVYVNNQVALTTAEKSSDARHE